jgi:glycosyltransferase involved in cell wall biosynthesis
MVPQVSVILPYYNGQKWLPRAVQSVQVQQEVSWELIVVDDGSEDTAEDILHKIDDFRIKYVYIDHCGKGGAINRGVMESKSDIICFLDQDDIMLPQRLLIQLKAFEKLHFADGVYSDYERRYESGELIDQVLSGPAIPLESIHLLAVGRNSVTMQTLMLKKCVYIELGGFSNDSEMTGLDDLDFFVRLFLSKAHLVYEPGVVQYWVKHDQNYSNSGSFQDARLRWLNRLSQLAQLHPMLNSELKYFRFHTYAMRGLHFLENGRSELALAELFKALSCKPNSTNTYYLILKSVIISCGKYLKFFVLWLKGKFKD